jgi:hypothetical protein
MSPEKLMSVLDYGPLSARLFYSHNINAEQIARFIHICFITFLG